MKKFARCGFFVCALLSAWCTDALAVIININANTNWSAITTGSGVGGQPNSTDNIIVLRGATLTVDVGNGQCASIQLGRDTGGVGQRGNGTLLFNAASQVTVSGIVTLGDNTNGGNRTGSITMTAGGTLILTGFTVNVFGAWTPGNGTVELSATNTLPTQLNASGYNNLTVNGAGTTTSLSGTVTVAGALNVAAGTLAVGANTLNVGGNFTVNGTLSDTGPVNLTGSGTTIDGTGSVTDTGTVTISTGNKTVLSTANLSFAGTIAISGAITVTNNGTITSTAAGGITGSVAGSTWTNAANSTLNVSGPLLATGTLTASANPNTVNYAGAAQTVRLPSAGTYFHLTLSGSGSKTMPAGTITVAGNLTLTGATYDGTTNNPTVNLAGNFTESGTFNSGTGIFTFNGTGAQTLSGTSTNTTFANPTLNNASGLTINHNVTVSTLLTLTSGVISTGTNTVITSANCPGSVSRTSGHVAGFLSLRIPAGSPTCTFDVGDSTTWRGINLIFTAGTTAGNLTGSVSQSAGEHPNISTSGLDSTGDVNRFWTLTNSGVGLGAGGYSATFNFVAGDLDAGADTTIFEVRRWDGTSWSAPAVGTRTATSTQATGITAFSDFAVGRKKIDHFAINIGGAAGNTCAPKNIIITAQNAANATLTNYTGTINITTSASHGNWAIVTGAGTLTPGVADSGAASYAFAAADMGVVTLSLSDTHADDTTVSVVDSGIPSTLSTSATINFRGDLFVIVEDPIQVAGRNQAMTVTMKTGGGACATATAYTGAKTLKAWLTRDPSDPGGAAPTIGAVSLPNAVPGANNLTLTFTSGVATFNLSTTDVGKYVLNLRDDSRVFATGANIDGSSNTLTTRPFALAISAISQGATTNPGGTATAGSKFIAAADTFQATIGAYRYNSVVDVNNDGVPDAGATLAQVTANGAAPSYSWPTTLSAASPFTPGTGTLGTLSNGLQSGACPTGSPNCFSSGVATPNNLSYNEVGSFTISGVASNFLNSGITLNALIFDQTGSQSSGVIGRFFPDHFTLLAGSTITPACGGAAGFTYMGQPNLGFSFTIEARNKSDVKTSNYINSPVYATGTVTMLAENNNNGTDLSSRLPAPTGSWSAGTYSFTTTTATFSRLASPDGPFDSLQIGVRVTDADGPVLASRDMDPATSTVCTLATCTGTSIGGATTKVRFGRLRLQNANGSELISMPIPISAQYWNGSGFVTNSLDTCSTFTSGNITFANFNGLTLGMITPITIGGAFTAGIGSLRLKAPGAGNRGSVDVTVDLTGAGKTYLQGAWTGATYTDNPTSRATFGTYRNTNKFIYQRENF